MSGKDERMNGQGISLPYTSLPLLFTSHSLLSSSSHITPTLYRLPAITYRVWKGKEGERQVPTPLPSVSFVYFFLVSQLLVFSIL